MKMKLLLSCMVVLLVFSVAPAQTTGVPGTNDFTINNAGSGGTSPVDPALTSVIENLTLQVSTTPGLSVFGLAANATIPGVFAFPPIVAPTSLDLDPVSMVIWLDSTFGIPGLGGSNVVPSSGNWTLSLPVSLAGGEVFNLQMAILDPATGMFTMTQAHSGTVAGFTGILTSFTLTSSTTGSVALTVPVNFYGTSRTSLDISPHGYLKFGNPTSDFSPTIAEFFGGFPDASNPGSAGVALAWSDYAPSQALTMVDVLEDTTNGTVQVQFNNIVHWSGGEPAGNFSATFGLLNPGSVELDLTAFTSSTTSAVPIIIGVTNGTLTSGPLTDLSTTGGIAGAIGTYISPSPQDSVGEFIPANGPVPFGIAQFIDIGAAPGDGTWNIL